MPAADFTTVQRLDAPAPPNVSAGDSFFEFLFSRAPETCDALKRKAAAQEPLPSFHLDGVKTTFNIDADYHVVRTQLAQLKNTFVAFGAHYDHVGYAEGEVTRDASGARRAGAPGRVTKGAEDDRIGPSRHDGRDRESRRMCEGGGLRELLNVFV